MYDTDKRCGNCGGKMSFLGCEQVQLGKSSLIFGGLPNLLSGALDVEIWCCSECGKLDFYRAEQEEEGHIAQVTCPGCGVKHDLDDPKCPYCGAKNPNILLPN